MEDKCSRRGPYGTKRTLSETDSDCVFSVRTVSDAESVFVRTASDAESIFVPVPDAESVFGTVSDAVLEVEQDETYKDSMPTCTSHIKETGAVETYSEEHGDVGDEPNFDSDVSSTSEIIHIFASDTEENESPMSVDTGDTRESEAVQNITTEYIDGLNSPAIEENINNDSDFITSLDDLLETTVYDGDDTLNPFDEDSDTDCITDENLNDGGNTESEPLFPGAALSLGAMMLLLALFFTKHNLVGDGIEQLLNILAFALPNGNRLCTSLYAFKKFFEHLKTPIIKHFYCGYCQGFIADPSLVKCPYSSCGKDLNQNIEHFLELPIDGQLTSLFSQEGFYRNIQGRFNRKVQNTFHDIYDGSLYKSYFENDGPLSCPSNISFTFNTDGASVFKSSNVSVWPLFLVINELPYKTRMKKENMILAGLWFGKKKPAMGTYLQPFLEKFQALEQGFNVFSPDCGQLLCKAFLLCGTADLPARCLLCNSVQYNGSYSCWKCMQSGETAKVGKGYCHVFPFKDAPKQPVRTKESVLSDSRKALERQESGVKKYLVNGVKGPSWLTFFPKFNVVDGIAIDYMHGVLLGVQKLLLNLWFSATHKKKTFNFYDLVCKTDSRLLSIRPTLNISRLPRSIQTDLKYWKASELRAFLLYYGAPVLKGILDIERLVHYLLLVNSIHILLKSGTTETELASAELMLFEFVKQFSTLYGSCFMTLNLHQLVHLTDSVRTLGPLYTHSCFSFEDKNGVLLRMIRGTQNFHNQIITGVSFLQKLPELKLQTIRNGTELERLYNSIEHPNILTRGLKIADSIFVLGSVKSRILTDSEHTAISDHMTYEVLQENTKFFKRLEFYENLIYGTTYSRMTKRDNSSICFKKVSLSDSETYMYGRVRYFVILDLKDNLYDNVFAIVEDLQCKNYSNSSILAVDDTSNLSVVPLRCIVGSCMYVSYKNSDNSKTSYVCRFPNTLESD